MNKILITIVLLFIGFVSFGQVAQSRYITIKDGKSNEFLAAAEKKTQLYNSKEGQTRFYTFRITTGSRTGDLFRARVEDSIKYFDNTNPKELEYWMNNVAEYQSSSNNQIWWKANNASYSATNESKPQIRTIIYTVKSGSGNDFWRFRNRVKIAVEESEADIIMSVWNCFSGCDGNVVRVSFSHSNHDELYKDNNIEWPKVVAKYNELYGNGSYEEDISDLDSSLEMYGRTTVHMERIDELSSPF